MTTWTFLHSATQFLIVTDASVVRLTSVKANGYLSSGAKPAPVSTPAPAPVPAGLEGLSPEVAALLAQLGAKP